MKFSALALCEPLLRSLQDAGYQAATPIQEQAIPKLLTGRDLIGCAQTGTGKTAAFTLPVLQRLMAAPSQPTGASRRRQRQGRRAIRSLILTPTRELAAQIGDSLKTYGKYTNLKQTVLFGGVSQGPQVRALQAGVDILVATPGRLLDLIQQGFVKLAAVEVLILDEADQMLDMGFIHDLRKIVARVPERRQTLMFSATMPREIRELAKQWLDRPFEVKVTPVASTPELVSQTVYFVEKKQKPMTLRRFLNATVWTRTLVFSRTKYGADKIARTLERRGIHAISIHGNKSQARRQAAIREFNSSQPPVLVATDLASRGLDFSGVSHVINYDLPEVPEIYVHRIGRTARAGATGQAISFCSPDEQRSLRMIERLTGQAVPVALPPGATGEEEPGDSAAPSAPTREPREKTESGPRKKSARRPRRRKTASRPGAASPRSQQRPRKGPRKRRKTTARAV
ncbi:MAG: DEAD/DEAH box helicase [Planctomycetota bacterium]|nr:DEAD/DEAH box helicase [Planctomycetota bacterium]